MSIHPTAVIHPEAEVAQDVIIHPYTIVEAGVRIGDGCEIGPNAVIRTGTRMGRNNRVTVGAVLGEHPQDLKFKGEESYLDVGDGNLIREYVTLHRATGEGNSTVIGNESMLMAYCHVGHNCSIGSNVMLANCVQCGGHVVIEDFSVIGGLVGIHQFVRVGTMCMIAAGSGVRIDVPHYMLVEGRPARPRNINVVGVRRHGVSKEGIEDLRRAFKALYRSELNTSDAIERIRAQTQPTAEIENLIEFLENIPKGERGRQLD